MKSKLSNKVEEIDGLIQNLSRMLEAGDGLKKVEDQLQDWLNGLGGALSDEILDKTDEPVVANSIIVDGVTLHFAGNQKRIMRDRFGHRHTFHRRVYRKRNESGFSSGGPCCVPMDELLGFSVSGEFSPGLSSMVCALAANLPYGPSAELLDTLVSVEVSATGVQKTAERMGAEIGSDPADLVEPSWQGQPCDTMVISLDATGSPRISDEPNSEGGRAGLSNQTVAKMCTVIEVEKYIQQPQPRRSFDDPAPKPDHRVRVATYADSGFQEVDQLLRTTTLLCGRARARCLVFKGDGLASNWRLAQDWFPEAIQILDPYHALEHLAAFIRLVQRKSPDEPLGPCYFQWKKMMLEGDILNLIQDLKDVVKNARPADRKRASSEIEYFKSNSQRMEYDQYLKLGIAVGTGSIESACKQVVCSRFKKHGMRWKPSDNRAILNLRLHAINRTLDAQFSKQIRHRWALKNAA